MTVTEQLMGVGSWSLRLRPDTPASITAMLRPDDWGYSHVVITPVWIEHVTATSLLSAAIYLGILERQIDRLEVAGPGMIAWFGDELGRGDIEWTWGPSTYLSLAAAVSGLGSRYFAAIGTTHPLAGMNVVSTVTATHTVDVPNGTMREKLEHLCRLWGAEWKVNGFGGLDIGTAADLFGSTAQVVIGPHAQGWDGSLYGAHGEIRLSTDLANYATAVGVSDGTTTSYSIGSTAFKDITLGAVRRTQVESLGSTDAADLAGIAAARLSARNRINWDIDVSTDDYAAIVRSPVGSNVLVYSRDNEVWGTTIVNYRGELWPAAQMRVVGASWPVEQGMGVYVRGSDTASTVTDLTPWVEWEPSGTTLELAATRRVPIGTAMTSRARDL